MISESREDANKLLEWIEEETVKDMKDRFSEEMKILKKNQGEILEMKISVSLIKNSIESLSSRQDKSEERISRFEDQVDILEFSNNKKRKKKF